MTVDTRNLDVGDKFTIVLESGEVFEDAMVVDCDHHKSNDPWERAWVHLTIEGIDFEQVEDRVESEVLRIEQKSNRGGDWMKEAELFGTIWVGDPKEASTPEYKKLGEIKEIKT